MGTLAGCKEDTVPLAVERWYDFHEFGWHLGNVGLWKLVRSPSISPEQVEAVAKILRVFDKIPNTSDQFDAIIELSGPRRWYGEHEIWHYWHISIDQQALEVSSGGYFYRQSTGGDSFTMLHWYAVPGYQAELSDYLNIHSIVDDAKPFESEVAEINLDEPGYSLTVHVGGEEIAGEMEFKSHADEDDPKPDERVETGAPRPVLTYEEIKPALTRIFEGSIANGDDLQAFVKIILETADRKFADDPEIHRLFRVHAKTFIQEVRDGKIQIAPEQDEETTPDEEDEVETRAEKRRQVRKEREASEHESEFQVDYIPGDDFDSIATLAGSVQPCDDSERLLEDLSDTEKGREVGQTYLDAPDACDICGRNLDGRKYFVDGRLKGDLMWANMCSDCFFQRGEGLGWGKGQLYARLPDSEWLLVAGFSPE